jgi:hypothetical protein
MFRALPEMQGAQGSAGMLRVIHGERDGAVLKTLC